MDLSHQNLKNIEQLYENISTDCLDEASDTAKQWERITRGAGKAIERELVNPFASGVRAVADYSGQAASGIVRGVTGGAVDLEKIGKSAEKLIGSGGKPAPEPKPVALPTSQQNAKQPPSRDLGRQLGQFLAPPPGSPRAADPLVQQGGRYGFFGPIKPQVTKQPPVRPGDNKVKKDSKGAIIVNHFEVENDQVVSEAPAQVAPITGPGGKGWYQKDKEGKYVPITDPEKAKQAATRWKAQQDAKKLAADEKKTPVVGLDGPPKPQPEPKKKTVPAPERKTDAKVKPAPTPVRQPAPQASPVAKYMATAAAARKSGDPQKMAAARDMGLEIWRKKYAGTLAKNVNPDGTQKGTGQSVMAKQAAELRAIRPSTPPSSEVQTSAKSSLPGGDYSPAATSMMSQRTRNILGTQAVRPAQSEPLTKQPPLSTPQSDAAFKRSGETASALGLRATAANLAGPRTTPTAVPSMNVSNPAPVPRKPTLKKEAYDVVLEYLLSEGHADTVDEAHYVMMQMDAANIKSIVEMGDPSFQIKRSTGAGALTPSAAQQLGPKAVELQKKKAAAVDLPNLKQSPGSMAKEV